MKKVTVHHQGDIVGKETIIVDEDGQVMENVKSATIYLNAGEVPEITVELKRVSTNVEGRVTEVQVKCPCCDKMLEHKCEELIGPQPDEDVVEFQIQHFYIMPTSGQMVNGVWQPAQPISGTIGNIKLKVVKKP